VAGTVPGHEIAAGGVHNYGTGTLDAGGSRFAGRQALAAPLPAGPLGKPVRHWPGPSWNQSDRGRYTMATGSKAGTGPGRGPWHLYGKGSPRGRAGDGACEQQVERRHQKRVTGCEKGNLATPKPVDIPRFF